MNYSYLIHTLLFTRFTSENSWADNLSSFITQPFISLILTCIIFLGFLYQLYSKRINLIGIIASLALLLLAGIRERLEYANTPKNFKGVPIAFITAGLLAMAFMGFSGMQI